MGLYELSGEEILGADPLDQYLMGALPVRRPTYQQPQAYRPPAATVRTKPPTTARELILGFDSVTVVTKSTSRKITTRAQQIFRPDRLIVAAAIAASFTVDDLKVGTNSQFLSGDSVPAEAFSNVSVGVKMHMDTVNPGIDVVLTVTNIDAANDHRFNGALIGPSVK